MLNVSDIVGSGFTIITSDMTFDETRDQASINKMFEEIRIVLNNYGFDISIVADQESAMRFQGKLLFNEMFRKLDEMCRDHE